MPLQSCVPSLFFPTASPGVRGPVFSLQCYCSRHEERLLQLSTHGAWLTRPYMAMVPRLICSSPWRQPTPETGHCWVTFRLEMEICAAPRSWSPCVSLSPSLWALQGQLHTTPAGHRVDPTTSRGRQVVVWQAAVRVGREGQGHLAMCLGRCHTEESGLLEPHARAGQGLNGAEAVGSPC